MRSIRVKITLITVAAILTTILGVFAACYTTVQAESDRRSVEMMNLIGSAEQEKLEKYFIGVEQSVEMASKIAGDTLDSVFLVENGVSVIRGNVRTSKQQEKLDEYLTGHCEAIQTAFESVASRTQGVITYYYCISPDISVNEHGFFYSKVGKPGFAQQPPLDARELDPNDLEHTTWYYTPIKRGRPSWIGPYTAHFLNELLTCSYIVPIYKSGVFIGVLGMDIAFDTLASNISELKVFDTGFACLLDDDGRILYHPKLEWGQVPELTIIKGNSDLFENKSSGSELILYETDGEQRQMSFSTLSNGMKLVITAPSREINASWVRLTRLILLVTAIMIAVFSAILLFVMNIITRPLVHLTAASQKLAAADYDVELEYSGRDEVGMLTGAFKGMRDQLKLYIADLNRRILTDSLTGLPNMRYFFELAESERKVIANQGKSPVILFFNLIGMKQFNRQYGFDEGDRMIRDIGNILLRHYGEHRVGRYGQDHFTAIAPLEGISDELNAIFKECSRIKGGASLPVRVGVYQYSLEDVNAGVACDRAKYACDKHRGAYVSGVTYFDGQMLSQLENVQYVINNLDKALENRWVKVYYQPIIRAANNQVCDEEALSRWIDPEKGMLSPAEFIPILEKARLIYKLDLYMLDRMLENMQVKRRDGLTVVPHSLNLSRSDFDACDIVEEIRSRVDDAGVPRNMVTIEITESMVGSDFDFIKRQVQRFQELGFPVWMDDFGSGYSSLDVLQDIKFDLLKFDMRFMHRFGEGDESKIILTELTRMASSMGIDTVCEGVETKEQVDFLREIGCTKLQGYYFSKPIPLETIIRRDRQGPSFGFENPAETGYYEAIGRVSLYDFAPAVTDNGRGGLFNAIPMGVMEIHGENIRFLRTNQPFRAFLKRFCNVDIDAMPHGEAAPIAEGSAFLQLIENCCGSKDRAFFDERMPDGTVIHSFVQRVCDNPVTGAIAITAAVLSITDSNQRTVHATAPENLDAGYFSYEQK